MAPPQGLAADLTALGYLPPGGNEKYALRRFQRRALSDTRQARAGGSLCVVPTFRGRVTGVADQATLDEIALWKKWGYVAPLGIYRLDSVRGGGMLRDDVAAAWNNLVTKIASLGGTIAGPYGDTKRPLMKSRKVGASKYSFHTAGRAIDLNQALGNHKDQRYFVVQEPGNGATYWRIHCKTDQQTGSQGKKIEKKTTQAYRFGDGVLYWIPEGYYLDLTAEIERNGQFERIPAQSGWGPSGSGYNKTEWWHFQWAGPKEFTFHDEVELIGVTEKELRDSGYTDADLDHAPG